VGGRVDDGHHAAGAVLAGILRAVDGHGVGVGDGDAEDLVLCCCAVLVSGSFGAGIAGWVKGGLR
jgi:hypothetical protein